MEVLISPADAFVNPLANFQTPRDLELLSLYRAGYAFVIWRGSSPWNTFLRKPGTEGTDDVNITGDDLDVSVGMWDFIRMGNRLPWDDRGTIQRSLTRRELGQPFMEAYGFDQGKLDDAQATWSKVGLELEEQALSASDVELYDISQLSEEALSLVKLMHPRQRYNRARLFPYAELMPLLGELKQRKVVELARNSSTYWYQLRAPYAQGPVPKVKKLALKFGARRAPH
jgi:hypothetical protein